MGSIEQPAARGHAAQPEPTLDQVLELAGLTDAPRPEQRRALGKLAYSGRLPLAWLKVLRQADFLPYDEHHPDR